MMRLFRKISKKAGLPPGTLMSVGEKKGEKTSMEVFRYSKEQCEKRQIKIEDLTQLKEFSGVTWLNSDGLNEIDTIETIGRVFNIHDLVLEDILTLDQRPKVDDHEEYLFVILKMIYSNESKSDIETEQVSLILKKGFVLSFQERKGDVFDVIRERMKNGKGRIRRMGTDYLVYALMDAVVDNYFVVMENLGEEIEALEDEIIQKPDPKTSANIHDLRRKVILLRRSIWPLREVINGLVHSESDLIKKQTKLFIRDLYDHTIQIIETLETFRDILSGMLDIYLSSASNRMNEVMKVLTIIATLFIPLSFLAGIYGMNFKYMPELEWKWAYPVLWGVMIVVVIMFLIYFKRKKWI